jgi:hypothetical protein
MESVALIPLNPPAGAAHARGAAWSGSAALKYWHLTSLDAPTVAVTWAYGFAWAAHLRLAPWAAALLALVVWAIYVGDRLLDARAGLADRHRLQERHWFHWRHRRVLAALAGVAGVAAVWMVESHLRSAALCRDSLLGLATAAYFTGVHGPGLRAAGIARWRARAARMVSRELLVGLIFSAGCVLPVLPMTGAGAARVSVVLAGPAAAFAALAWLNVRAIGQWENALRQTGTRRLAARLASIFVCGAIALAWMEPRAAVLLLMAAASALTLAWLDEVRQCMDALTLRAAADLVLLTPLLLLVWAGLQAPAALVGR